MMIALKGASSGGKGLWEETCIHFLGNVSASMTEKPLTTDIESPS